MRRHAGRRRGGSALEFTLVGIPTIFVLISTFEMARGMWIYHSLAYAVREGTRYAVVHGYDCTVMNNTCTVTLGQVAQVIANAAPGLIPANMNVTFTAGTSTVSCALNSCVNNATTWPPSPNNTRGSVVAINATYPFRSAIAMFWPGAGRGMTVPAINFPAQAQETIQF